MTKNPLYTVAITIGLGLMGMLAMDMYVPALPHIALSFATTSSNAKFTMIAYMLGICLSPLFFGPMADKYGRRPLILWGAAFAIAAMILAALSPTIHWLIFARLIQGLSLGIVVALSRTVATDLYSGNALAKIASIISLFVAVGPALAPIIGGSIQLHYGWPWIFVALAAGIGVFFLLCLKDLTETAHQLNPNAMNIKNLLHNYKTLLKSPIFIGIVTVVSLSYAGAIGFFTLSPFIMLHQFHLNSAQIGLCMASITLMAIISRIMNIYLLKFFDSKQCIFIAIHIMLIGSLMMLISWVVHWHSIYSLIIPMMIYILGSSIVFPNAVANALPPFKHIGGQAAALYSSLQMLGSFLGAAMASIMPNSTFILALFLIIISTSAWLIFMSLTKPAMKKQRILQTAV